MKLTQLIIVLIVGALAQLPCAVAQAQGGLLLHDDFEDNRNDWPLVNSEEAVTDIREGKLMLQHLRATKSLSMKKHVPINESLDYMIVAEFVKYDFQREPGFGICWGRLDEDNEYNFIISSKGSFKIFRMFNGNVQNLIDWQTSKHIRGETGLNRLSIKKVGEDMLYYINHHLVAKTKVMPFMGDLTGLKVYHAQKVGVELFSVYQR